MHGKCGLFTPSRCRIIICLIKIECFDHRGKRVGTQIPCYVRTTTVRHKTIKDTWTCDVHLPFYGTSRVLNVRIRLFMCSGLRLSECVLIMYDTKNERGNQRLKRVGALSLLQVRVITHRYKNRERHMDTYCPQAISRYEWVM